MLELPTGIGIERLTSLARVHLVAEGHANRDISRESNLGEHTVRNHLFRIFNKLGAWSRLELALCVINQRDGTETSSSASASRRLPPPGIPVKTFLECRDFPR